VQGLGALVNTCKQCQQQWSGGALTVGGSEGIPSTGMKSAGLSTEPSADSPADTCLF